MTVYNTGLKQSVLEKPYREGRRKLSVITGYASAPFILELLNDYPKLELEVIIGMAKVDPLTQWNHQEFQKMVESYAQLDIKYFIGERPIHSKIYYWHPTEDQRELVFVGSANLTRNGFINYQEILALVEMGNPMELFREEELVDCVQEDVADYMTFLYSHHEMKIDTNAIKEKVIRNPFVDLPLTETGKKTRKVHERAGLNWGQREGRDKNQAYIPIPSLVRKSESFFPPRKERFTMLTDDGESFICARAQDNGKAIQTPHDNSLLGRYFRKRLGLRDGEPVKINHLDQYGRDSVRIYKLDEETYYMDFYSG